MTDTRLLGPQSGRTADMDKRRNDRYKTVGTAMDKRCSDSYKTVGMAIDKRCTDRFKAVGAAMYKGCSDKYRLLGQQWTRDVVKETRDVVKNTRLFRLQWTRDECDKSKTVWTAMDKRCSDRY